MPTPHNAAQKGQIAETVLMPGDPLRAQFIAETYLENPVQFNSIRGMLGFTGTYGGKTVSVMGSGMGMPSIGIYSYELFSEYDVENIIRVGTCGAYQASLRVFDVILVRDAYSTSSFARYAGGFEGDLLTPSLELYNRLRLSAQRQDIRYAESRAHSSDVFYSDIQGPQGEPYWQYLRKEKSCDIVEMEAFGLFYTAMLCKKKAACVLTVSDSFVSHSETTAMQRERSFTNMMKVALGIL